MASECSVFSYRKLCASSLVIFDFNGSRRLGRERNLYYGGNRRSKTKERVGVNGVLQNNNVPRPLPHTVHSNSKSSITVRINDREFITLARTNKTPALQARFHFTVGLLSNKSQKTSKCGKNISDNVFVPNTF